MKNRLISLFGCICFLITLGLNLNHTNNNYGVNSRKLYTILEAATSSGTGSGTWTGSGTGTREEPKVYDCYLEDCTASQLFTANSQGCINYLGKKVCGLGEYAKVLLSVPGTRKRATTGDRYEHPSLCNGDCAAGTGG